MGACRAPPLDRDFRLYSQNDFFGSDTSAFRYRMQHFYGQYYGVLGGRILVDLHPRWYFLLDGNVGEFGVDGVDSAGEGLATFAWCTPRLAFFTRFGGWWRGAFCLPAHPFPGYHGHRGQGPLGQQAVRASVGCEPTIVGCAASRVAGSLGILLATTRKYRISSSSLSAAALAFQDPKIT